MTEVFENPEEIFCSSTASEYVIPSNKMLQELKAYQETGLTPEGVQEMLEHGKVVAEALFKYLKDEEDGFLIRLPFLPHTVVWRVTLNVPEVCYDCEYFSCIYKVDLCNNPEVTELENRIEPSCAVAPICSKQKWVVVDTMPLSIDDVFSMRTLVGTSIFLTIEEAQAECDRRNKEYREKHDGS